MTSTNVEFILESSLKLGQFSLSQQDLIIPVKRHSRFPITRTYNSINPNRGDTGLGDVCAR